MRGALLFIAIFALSMLVIPMIAMNSVYSLPPEDPTPQQAGVAAVSQGEDPAPEALAPPDTPPARPADAPEPAEPAPGGEEAQPAAEAVWGVEAFRVLDESTGEIHTVPVQDYVRGAVAAEMPARFHPEALKAQAVAAHTYALYNHFLQQRNPDPALQGADFRGDPSHMKVYVTEERARAFYGDQAEEYWGKICQAADSVSHLVLAYDDEPIVAAYHAMSAGRTEDAANVWVGDAPYLAPVDSEGDLLAPDYETEAAFTYGQIRDAFGGAWGISFPEDSTQWFTDLQRSDSGYVTSIAVGDQTLHGSQVRTALGLRSHNFEILPTDTGFLFVVYGHGHGVGLSQYGADFMARQGAGYEEILANYYTGATLAQVQW